MKKLQLTGIAMLFLGFTAFAQKGNTPKNVQDAFNKKFPSAKEVKWDKENETEWEAEFEMNGKEYSANFTSDGKWKETEHAILKSEIPAAVKNTLTSDFSGYDIEESEISETASGKTYEFELEKGKSMIEVGIDANGKVTKKEEKKGESDEEDEDEEND